MFNLCFVCIRGKVQCSLFGDYVDVVNKYFAEGGHGLPVVIVQYAKVKTFRGNKLFDSS